MASEALDLWTRNPSQEVKEARVKYAKEVFKFGFKLLAWGALAAAVCAAPFLLGIHMPWVVGIGLKLIGVGAGFTILGGVVEMLQATEAILSKGEHFFPVD